MLGLARIYDMLNDPETAITYYKKVLVLDASSVEAIACLGAHFFYSDQVCMTCLSFFCTQTVSAIKLNSFLTIYLF